MAIGGSGTPGAVRPGDLGPAAGQQPGQGKTSGRFNFWGSLVEPVTGLSWPDGEGLVQGATYGKGVSRVNQPSDNLNNAGNPPLGVHAAALFDTAVSDADLVIIETGVQPGNYQVDVITNEAVFTSGGARVFDLHLQGSIVESGVDLYARNGNDSVILSHVVAVTDGGLGTGDITVRLNASTNLGVICALRYAPASYILQPEDVHHSHVVESPQIYLPSPAGLNVLQIRRSSVAGNVPADGVLASGELAVNNPTAGQARIFVGDDAGAPLEVGAPGRVATWGAGDRYTTGDTVIGLVAGARIIFRAVANNYDADPVADHDQIFWRPETALDSFTVEYDSAGSQGAGLFVDLQKAVNWVQGLYFARNATATISIKPGTHTQTQEVTVDARMGYRIHIRGEVLSATHMQESDFTLPTDPGVEAYTSWTQEREAYCGVSQNDHAGRAETRFDAIVGTMRSNYGAILAWESAGADGLRIKSRLGSLSDVIVERNSAHAYYQQGTGINLALSPRSSIDQLSGCIIAGWGAGIRASQGAYLRFTGNVNVIAGCSTWSLHAVDSWIVAQGALILAHSGDFAGLGVPSYGLEVENCNLNAEDLLILDAAGGSFSCRACDLRVNGLRILGATEGAKIDGCNISLRASQYVDSEIKWITGKGFALIGSGGSVDRLRVQGCGEEGICVDGAVASFVDSHALSNEGSGLLAHGSGSSFASSVLSSQAARCRFSANGANGMHVEAGSVRAHGAEIKLNNQSGVVCDTGQVFADLCDVDSNNLRGFLADKGGRIERSTCIGAQAGDASPTLQTPGAPGTSQAGSTVT